MRVKQTLPRHLSVISHSYSTAEEKKRQRVDSNKGNNPQASFGIPDTARDLNLIYTTRRPITVKAHPIASQELPIVQSSIFNRKPTSMG